MARLNGPYGPFNRACLSNALWLIVAYLKARTEELLYLLSWSAGKLLCPSRRNPHESFEGWAYRNGFLKEIALLEKRRFLERQTASERVYRLTSEGRVHALGGRDPEAQWSRLWDGRWRLVCFDVPIFNNKQRGRLRRYLRNRGFGCLQRSIWITPDKLAEEMVLFRSTKTDVKSLILLEARACAGESDSDIVAAAWDFDAIHRRYQRHLKILTDRPLGRVRSHSQAAALRRWATAERIAWNSAVKSDPLLPRKLLPREYLGERAWCRRVKALELANKDRESFHAQHCS